MPEKSLESKRKRKYIVILGSIMSGLGKGIVSASIIKLLLERGLRAYPIKFDGYLNVDCGTMNPFRHGEVFVLKDGSEVDMDFGTYERFMNKDLDGKSSLTGGKIFKTIIERERKGNYLGRDVQFIPHVTDYIKEYVRSFAEEKNADVVVIEVGGTVGDIENSYFIEAMRQLSLEEDVLFIQLTYIPIIKDSLKTKPTQHANKLIQSYGISPKLIIARTQKKLGKEEKEKISLYCNVESKDIFDDIDVAFVYELPMLFEKQGLFERIKHWLKIKERKQPEWKEWKKRLSNLYNYKDEVRIAIVGKYTKIRDAYISIEEALTHASAETKIKVNLEYKESSKLEKEGVEELKNYHGIIIAGGFGKRGIEGKIKAIEFARKNEIPLLGLCLGMQLMVVEFARNVVGLSAHSSEFNDNAKDKVVDLLPEQRRIAYKGGTMRLGEYVMEIKEGTLLYDIYKKKYAGERHRHRYEINPEYVEILEKHGLIFSAFYKGIAEAVEYKNKLGLGVQSHPELSSKFEKPSPIFVWFVRTAREKKLGRKG